MYRSAHQRAGAGVLRGPASSLRRGARRARTRPAGRVRGAAVRGGERGGAATLRRYVPSRALAPGPAGGSARQAGRHFDPGPSAGGRVWSRRGGAAWRRGAARWGGVARRGQEGWLVYLSGRGGSPPASLPRGSIAAASRQPLAAAAPRQTTSTTTTTPGCGGVRGRVWAGRARRGCWTRTSHHAVARGRHRDDGRPRATRAAQPAKHLQKKFPPPPRRGLAQPGPQPATARARSASTPAVGPPLAATGRPRGCWQWSTQHWSSSPRPGTKMMRVPEDLPDRHGNSQVVTENENLIKMQKIFVFFLV